MPNRRSPAPPGSVPAEPPRRRAGPVDAVLFDFHGTLAQVEDPVDVGAGRRRGVRGDPGPGPGDRAGRPAGHRRPGRRAAAGPGAAAPGRGVGRPGPVRRTRTGPRTPGWPRPSTPASTGSPRRSTSGCCAPRAGCRTPTPRPPCGPCTTAGVPVAVVSNIGFDIRPLFAAWGLADLVDACVLSYEVGAASPTRRSSWRACGALGVRPGADADGRRHAGRRRRGGGRLRGAGAARGGRRAACTGSARCST